MKQSGCSTCNQTHSLLNGMQVPVDCVNVVVKAPPAITVKSITIEVSGMTADTCPSGLCSDITCLTSGCTDIVLRDVVVTLENSGDIDANVALTLNIRESPTLTSPKYVTILAATFSADIIPVMTPGSASVTFADVALSRGSNDICATFTFVPYSPP